MTESLSKHERNLSAVIHASTFSKFFLPFGNFILPLILWISNRNQYEFVDHNGKQALNFQISLLLYSIIIGMISIPFFISFLPDIFDGGLFHWGNFHEYNVFDIHISDRFFERPNFWWPVGITGVAHLGLFVVNVVYTILATVRTNEGQVFKYPLTINFIK